MQRKIDFLTLCAPTILPYHIVMTDHWTEFTDFALALAAAAATQILPHFRQNTPVAVKEHEHWDPVTEGDKAGERAMRHLIEKHYPSHGIIGEEYGEKKGTSGLTWILDPVDGTRAFVIGLPVWATLIALYEEGKPRIGVMAQPFIGDIFFGNPQGAWLDHRGARAAIRVSRQKDLSQAMVGTTAPHLFKGPSAAAFERLASQTQHVRFGLDAYSYTLVAASHLDIALDAGLQIHDIAALVPIVKGAGGVVGSWTGDDAAQGGNVICASNQQLLDKAIAVMAG
jgi:histidinol phosphatase-like enzyme (inositol monophosphatase family)